MDHWLVANSKAQKHTSDDRQKKLTEDAPAKKKTMPLSMKLMVSQKVSKAGDSVTALLMFHLLLALP